MCPAALLPYNTREGRGRKTITMKSSVSFFFSFLFVLKNPLASAC